MSDSNKLREYKIASKEIFNGNLLHVFIDDVRLPNGHTATREYIKHPGAAAVLPIFDNGDIMLVKQFRYPLNKIFYEVPAGKIDEAEEPKTTAARELQEEAGLLFENLQYLAPFHPSIGYTDEIIHLYCAWNVTVTEPQVDDDEFLLRERLPFKKALQMVYDGQITDGKSMVNLLLAWRWWQEQGPFEI